MMLRRSCQILSKNAGIVPTLMSKRFMAARGRKRFYNDASIVYNGGAGEYEICLDHRKLKTPMGNEFKLSHEGLARMVAEEWRAQEDVILQSQMHLTGLCNVCIDNPTGATPHDLVQSSLNYLDTDTILFFSDNNEALLKKQEEEWQPIIDWFNQRHGNILIEPSKNMKPPLISSEAKESVEKYLLSHNFHCINGFSFAADAIKSLILTSAVMERRLSVEDGVRLSRLEVQTQTEKWGNVEWAHDLEMNDTKARMAAATLFVHFNSSQHLTKEKNIQQS